MSTQANGLIAVYESNSATSGYTLTSNDIDREGTLSPEAIENELANTKSQSGDDWNPEIHIYDMSKYSGLKTRAIQKQRRFYAFEFPGNVVYRTSQAVPIMITPRIEVSRLSGDSRFTMRFQLADTEAVVVTTKSAIGIS